MRLLFPYVISKSCVIRFHAARVNIFLESIPISNALFYINIESMITVKQGRINMVEFFVVYIYVVTVFAEKQGSASFAEVTIGSGAVCSALKLANV